MAAQQFLAQGRRIRTHGGQHCMETARTPFLPVAASTGTSHEILSARLYVATDVGLVMDRIMALDGVSGSGMDDDRWWLKLAMTYR